MAIDVVVWSNAYVEGACSLREMTGFDDEHKLLNGTALAHEWPKTVRFKMDSRSRKNHIVPDNVNAVRHFPVVSERLASFLKAHELSHVEYLPVTIVDHDKRPLPAPFFALNLLEPIDALNVEASDVAYSKIKKTSISHVKRLALDASRLDSRRELFRLQKYRFAILTSCALADAIDAAGFTGLAWTPPLEYASD